MRPPHGGFFLPSAIPPQRPTDASRQVFDSLTVLANWAELLTPTDAVASVFGRSGVVTAQLGDDTTSQVTESGNLYHTAARVRGADHWELGEP